VKNLIRVVLVGIVVFLSLGMVAIPAARAAVILTCGSGTAPSIASIASDAANAHYYYSCNVPPSQAGVAFVEEDMQLQRSDGTVLYHWVDRPASQQSAATKIEWCDKNHQWCYQNADNSSLIGVGPGTYRAHEELILQGSFSYGSVPGCGRADPNTIVCTWASATWVTIS
jgi:hypothetical protein